LFKRGVRFHCIKAIRKNPDYAPQWALLAEAYVWIVSLGGESKKVMPTMEAIVEGNITVNIRHKKPQPQRNVMRLVDLAIRYMKQAVNLEPENVVYRRKSKEYYRLKAELLCKEKDFS
jgi:hypothetical protein